MRCIDDGELRAYLDSEIDEAAHATIAAHLGDCAACEQRRQALRLAATTVAGSLAMWLPAVADSPSVVPDERRASAALARFQATLHESGREIVIAPHGWFDQIKEQVTQMIARLRAPRLRPVFATITAMAILGLILTLTPLNSLADQLFKTFRVQQFAAITVPVPGMKELPEMQAITPAQGEQVRQMLAALGTPTTNATKDSARPVADRAAAQAFMAQHGTTLRVPSKLPTAFTGQTAQYGTADPTSSTFALNVATAKQYLAFANTPELNALPWPAGVDTLTFGLDTPAAAVTIYGTKEQGFGIVQLANLPGGGAGAGPALKLPNELDVNAFRAALLALPGLPQETVAQVRNVQNWERTLIIPVPEDATTKNMMIAGNAGLLIIDGQGRGSIVVWQQDGSLYAVGGTLGEADILGIAGSLTK